MRSVVLLLPVILPVILVAGLLAASATPAGAWEPLPADVDADYQLGGNAALPDDVGVVVRDRRAAPAPERYNVCYVNAFQTQPDEKAFWQARPRLLLTDADGDRVVDAAWGEWLLDLRSAPDRRDLVRIVGRWIDRCAADGFDAVEFDNLDSFTRSRGLLTRADALTYARALVVRAHAADLAVAQKNLAGYDGRRLGFDFAIAEECGRYRECAAYVEDYGDQVLMVEYGDAGFARACAEFGDRVSVVRRDRALAPSYRPRWC